MSAIVASLRFTKMHGIGNDFVVLDCRRHPLDLDAPAIRRLGDRQFGVGFDQLLTIEPASDSSCAHAYGIYNRDGSRAGQCGNGVRCVAAWLRRDDALGAGSTRLQSPSGPVAVELLDDGRVRVDMGVPDFRPAALPLLAAPAARYFGDIGGRAIEFGAVSMGNPHAVIEVDDVNAAPVTSLGPSLECDAQFPLRANIGFVQPVSRNRILLRVWERGVGETLACGSGACAAVAVLSRRGQLDADVAVQLPGGELEISWQGEGHPAWMTGPAAFVFDGDYYR
ncbi:MAG: diaminopimelate epimerase [Tahibacter sp.]